MGRAPQIVTVAALLVGAAGFFYGWRETEKRRTAEVLLADALKARTELTRSAEMEKPGTLKTENIPAASPASSADDVAVVRRFQQDLARQRAKEAMAGAAAQQQLMASRKTQEEIARQFRTNLRLRYGAFFAERGFSEGQIAALENAMMEKYWTISDVLIATRGAGMSDHETVELRRQELAAIDEKIKLAVGDELYIEYQRYEATADARGLVESLAGKIFYREPLSPLQGAQLAAIITANINGVRRPDEWLRSQTFAGQDVGPSWNDVNWDGVLTGVGNLLSPFQLFSLRALAADAKLQENIARRLKEADQGGRETLRPATGSMAR